MQPYAGEFLVVCRFGLGDLVFVMRKCEVDTAGVDVERVAQVALAHGGALDVPARSAATEGRVPSGP